MGQRDFISGVKLHLQHCRTFEIQNPSHWWKTRLTLVPLPFGWSMFLDVVKIIGTGGREDWKRQGRS